MPDDLRWSWYNNSRNKVHIKCNVLESSWKHPFTTPSPRKSWRPWNQPRKGRDPSNRWKITYRLRMRNLFLRKKWQPTTICLPGESHGQRSLAGYSPQGHKESDSTERLTSTPPCGVSMTVILVFTGHRGRGVAIQSPVTNTSLKYVNTQWTRMLPEPFFSEGPPPMTQLEGLLLIALYLPHLRISPFCIILELKNSWLTHFKSSSTLTWQNDVTPNFPPGKTGGWELPSALDTETHVSIPLLS